MNQECVNASAAPVRRETLRRTVQLVLVGLCAFALAALYARYKVSPDDTPPPQAGAMPAGSAGAMPPIPVGESLDKLAERLAGKLARNPDDGEGWALLGRAYVELGQFDKAVPAYAKAVARIRNDPQLNAEHAEARRLAGMHGADGPLAGKIGRFAPQAAPAR